MAEPPDKAAQIFHAFENVDTAKHPQDITNQILTNLDNIAPGVKAEALCAIALIEVESIIMECLTNLNVIGGPKN